MVLGSTNQRGISVEPRHNQGLARNLRLAKGGALMGSGCVGFHTRIGRLILTCFAGFLLLYPVDGWGDEAPMDGAAGLRSDDWITINKDYSSQRYVDLDQITPKNVGKLKEIWCSEASCHSSGCKSRQQRESSPCCSYIQRQ